MRAPPAAPFAAATAFRPLPGDRPLPLRRGHVWIVGEGRVDVFATTPAREDGAYGHRTHLFRVEAGGPLFGVTAPGDGLELLAVGSTGTTLAELPAAEVWARAADPATRDQAVGLLHDWVAEVYEALAGRERVRRFVALDAGQETEADAGACVCPAPGVGWIEHRTGASRLMGRAEAPLGPGELLPVSPRGWVECDGPARLALRATAEVLDDDPGRAAAALDRLHGVLLAVTAARLAEADRAALARLRSRAEEGESVMAASLAGLAQVLDPAHRRGGMRLRAAVADAREDTLFAAFRLVAEAQGIHVELGAGGVTADRKNPVDALAQAARVRVRRVTLREGWWRGDAGPLLARTAEGSEPVALLPLAGGGYELWHPAERSGRRVDDAVAAGLEPFAWSLYRPFGPEPLGAWPLLRFGVAGSGRDLATAGMAALAVAGLALLTPIAIGILYDSIIPGAERGQLVQLACVLLVCALGTAAFQVVRGVALLRLETRIGTAVQAALWDRLLALPLPFFRDYSAGDLAVRAMGIEEIRRTLSGAAVSALVGGLFSLTNLALLVHYDLVLGAIAAALLAFAFGASLLGAWLQLRLTRETLLVRARSSGMVLQLLSGIAKLKVVGAEVRAFGVWARLFREQRRLRFRTRTLGGRLTVFNACYPLFCSMVLFHAILGRAGTPTALSTGEFLAFVAAFSLCLGATLSTSNALISSLGVVPLYEQLRPILQTPPESSAGKHPPGELSGAIELQHVHFRYHADGPEVLHDVSVRIHPGQFVAFVGPSGSGKSTLFRLLLGFEHPEAGSIYYDGQELSGLDIQALRRQVGVVLQQGRLMAGDLYHNIVGSSLATHDDAWEAARMAGLDDDIRQMPMGMHTVLNEGASTLSGGQRQRLMIARAVVNRPRILLFDEATSALDNRTQDIVTQSLSRLQTTRVVIAHRLSTIVNADQVYVVQGGRIVESGTCAELLARNGPFAEMARRQLI